MNYGTFGLASLFFALLVYGLPILLAVWFVKTVTSMSTSLREIAERLASLERAVRDTKPPNRA